MEGKEQPAESYAEEALDFVDVRLTQRLVKISVLGVSPQGQLIGSVKHPVGDIAVFALEEGLARCLDHHSTMLGAEMQALRLAERDAKQNRAGQFKAAAAAGTKDRQRIRCSGQQSTIR